MADYSTPIIGMDEVKEILSKKEDLSPLEKLKVIRKHRMDENGKDVGILSVPSNAFQTNVMNLSFCLAVDYFSNK